MSRRDCAVNPISSCVVAGNTNVLMARLLLTDGQYVETIDVDSIRVDVYQVTLDGRTAIDLEGTEITDGSAADAPEIDDVISDDLRTDSRWSRDSTGFNLTYEWSAPDPDTEYEVRISVTTTDEYSES